MKIFSCLMVSIFFALAMNGSFSTENPAPIPPNEMVIDNFVPPKLNDDGEPFVFSPGIFPFDWKYRDKKAVEIYGVVKEKENYYVKARSLNSGIQILKKFKVDLKEFPILSWKWRVIKLPSEEKPSEKNKSDNGASIYAIFSGFLSRTALKYGWSNYYTKGTFIDKSSQMKVIFLRDKTDPKNTWVLESRNLYEDYKDYFGKEPSKLTAIAIMSDSDDTESLAEADYSDFKMKSKALPSL